MRLEGHHHTLFQNAVAGGHHVRLLLVPPSAYSVSCQRHVALEACVVEPVVGEVVDVGGLRAGDTLFDGGAVDVERHLIDLLLLVGGIPHADAARLVARIAVEV